jgi:DNA-directed RNA polymerase specialized sigma24 family protein
VQQAFIDAYTHLHKYQLGTDFGAWIRTVTRNRLRKEYRTATREEQRLMVYREQLVERLRRLGPVPRCTS